jgi:hypothetical protein
MESAYHQSFFPGTKVFTEFKALRHSENLLHVTNRLYKEGISVQMRWTDCNKTNNFQCCQHHSLIRVLPEEPILFPPSICVPVG